MIGPVGFAARNLRRRGFHAFLAFLGLTTAVASTTFLLLLGERLVSRVNIESYSRATLGIAWIFSGYLLLSLAFVLVVGLLSTSHLVSAMVNQRMRDIVSIKAAGALPSRLFSYALTEALVVFSTSCLTGVLAALLMYASWMGSFQLSPAGTLIVPAVSGASFFLSYVAGRFQTGKILRASTVNVLSNQLSSLDLTGLGAPLRIRKFGSAFNVATRSLFRDRQFTRTAARVSICIFLTMVVLTGALVSWDTSRSYVTRAMPAQVLIVGAAPMVNQYVLLAGSFSNTTPIPRFDYLNGSYIVNLQLAETVRGIPGVEKLDLRLLTMENVTGYVKAHFASGAGLSGESTSPDLIPEAYAGSARALIVGIDPSQTIPNWYSSDGFLESGSPRNTMVAGDSLVGGIVQMPLNLSEVGWRGHRFNVKSALVDPLHNGMVLYTPLQSLQGILGISGTNILLVKVNKDPATFSRIQQFAGQNGLLVAYQDPILAANLGFLDNTWSFLLVLPILTLVLTCGILLSYLTTNYSKRFNDYVVLKVLGARARYILRLLLWEGWGIVAICMAIGFPAAFVFSTVFLVPGASIQGGSLGLSAIFSACALTGASMASAAVYWRRLRLMTVKDLR